MAGARDKRKQLMNRHNMADAGFSVFHTGAADLLPKLQALAAVAVRGSSGSLSTCLPERHRSQIRKPRRAQSVGGCPGPGRWRRLSNHHLMGVASYTSIRGALCRWGVMVTVPVLDLHQTQERRLRSHFHSTPFRLRATAH